MNDKLCVFINTVLMTSTTLVDNILFFIMSVLIARYFDLNQYGEYTASLAYATFFAMFADIGVNQVLVRCINLDHKKTEEYFGNAIVIKTVLCVIVYIALVISLFIINAGSDKFT